MDAPKCRLCDERHYGMCPSLKSAKVANNPATRLAEPLPTARAVRKKPPSVKRGRPRLEDADKTLEAQKPWVAAKMSRSSWYKRRAEKAAKP